MLPKGTYKDILDLKFIKSITKSTYFPLVLFLFDLFTIEIFDAFHYKISDKHTKICHGFESQIHESKNVYIRVFIVVNKRRNYG